MRSYSELPPVVTFSEFTTHTQNRGDFKARTRMMHHLPATIKDLKFWDLKKVYDKARKP